uniref:Nucleoporin NDC1 n=1 Tax=Astyanax mexicanus TaxID=7994 RepID=A0A8B9KKV4_ASTMX
MLSFNQDCWFVRKVVRWRALASIAWSVLLLPATTTLFVFLVRFSLFHPVEWISECFGLLTAASTIFSLILLCGVVLVIGFFNLEGYTVVPSIPCSRVALLAKVLHPRQCVHSLVHCTVGMMVMWCASVMAGGRYQALGSPCTGGSNLADAPEVCLNEYHLFLLLAGAFIGYSHSFLGVVQNMNYVSFQIIQQYKYLRCKGSLPWVLKCSAVQSLYAVRNYVALYFFFGHIPRAWISNSLNLPIDSSVHSLDSLTGLLDFSLLYHLWISGAFLLLTWYITVLLFRIYVTEVKGFMAKRVLVVYLFNKLPEASSQALFADSQAHIWALEGLSHLVAASFSEDKYGVVQTTLPSILGCMLSLQEAVDRHFKLPHASSKPVKTSCSMGDSTYKTLRFALRAALKTSIYRITSTFGEHLNAVCISAEHQKRLQQFMEYRE